jgi:hypothetical protein
LQWGSSWTCCTSCSGAAHPAKLVTWMLLLTLLLWLRLLLLLLLTVRRMLPL